MYSWHDYAMKVYDTIMSRHPNSDMFILVNDCYDDTVINVKDGEHKNRAKKYAGGESKNIFPVSSKPFPSASDFNAFFKNKGNKIRLQTFLMNEFIKRARRDDRTIIYCVRDECFEISTFPCKEWPEFSSNHVEADTMMFFVQSQLRRLGYTLPVVIDSEDSDVVALSAHVASKSDFQLCIKRKKGIFDCKKTVR